MSATAPSASRAPWPQLIADGLNTVRVHQRTTWRGELLVHARDRWDDAGARATRDPGLNEGRASVPTDSSKPRVWLAASPSPRPVDLPPVRDNFMREWQRGHDGQYHSVDGWHHATWFELHTRFDLVELKP